MTRLASPGGLSSSTRRYSQTVRSMYQNSHRDSAGPALGGDEVETGPEPSADDAIRVVPKVATGAVGSTRMADE